MRTRHGYWWIHVSMCCVFQSEDVVAVKSTGLQSTGNTGEYVVLRKCPAESAARLRVSEKHFVADHALLLAQRFGRGPCLDNSTLAKCWASRNVWEHHYSNWSGSSFLQIIYLGFRHSTTQSWLRTIGDQAGQLSTVCWNIWTCRGQTCNGASAHIQGWWTKSHGLDTSSQRTWRSLRCRISFPQLFFLSGNLEEPVHLDGSQHTQEAHQPSSINQHGPAFQDWCQHLGVITDAGNAVEGIKAGRTRSRHGSDWLTPKRDEHEKGA